MVTINGKKYLNLQEAVLANALDIAIVKRMAGYNGPYENLSDIVDPVINALYLVGNKVPYGIYQYNGSGFVYLGTFAANGAQGPAGPQGPQGPQGIPGEKGEDAINAVWFEVDINTGNLIMYYSSQTKPDIYLVSDDVKSESYYKTLGVSESLVGHLVFIYN